MSERYMLIGWDGSISIAEAYIEASNSAEMMKGAVGAFAGKDSGVRHVSAQVFTPSESVTFTVFGKRVTTSSGHDGDELSDHVHVYVVDDKYGEVGFFPFQKHNITKENEHERE